MDVAIYLRKSRADLVAEAKGEEETLARHERRLREFAAENGMTILHVYREVVSGDTIAARPQIQLLLEAVKCGHYQNILVIDIDRLSRGDLQDQGAIVNILRRHHCFIVTPAQTFDPNNENDMAYIEFGLFFARQEYRRIKGRLQAGHRAAVAEGQWVYVPPYGYEAVYLDGTRKRTLRIDPVKAEVVRSIFEMAYKGLSPGKIRLELWNRGIVSPSGNEMWHYMSLLNLLSNPAYLGKTFAGARAKGSSHIEVFDGLHEPIIDKKLWDQVQRIPAHAPVNRNKSIRNPFAGILVCANCGKPLVLRKNAGILYYEHCPKPGGAATRDCTTKVCKKTILDDIIVRKLKEDLDDISVSFTPERTDKTAAEQQQLLTRELQIVHRGIEKLFGLFERDLLDENEFLDRKNKASEKMCRIEQMLSELRSQDDAVVLEDMTLGLHQALSLLQTPNSNIKELNLFLRSFISEIRYDRSGPGRGDDASRKETQIEIAYKNHGGEMIEIE